VGGKQQLVKNKPCKLLNRTSSNRRKLQTGEEKSLAVEKKTGTFSLRWLESEQRMGRENFKSKKSKTKRLESDNRKEDRKDS